eukprot:350593-Chlamydomonas_euryale.AAC.3
MMFTIPQLELASGRGAAVASVYYELLNTRPPRCLCRRCGSHGGGGGAAHSGRPCCLRWCGCCSRRRDERQCRCPRQRSAYCVVAPSLAGWHERGYAQGQGRRPRQGRPSTRGVSLGAAERRKQAAQGQRWPAAGQGPLVGLPQEGADAQPRLRRHPDRHQVHRPQAQGSLLIAAADSWCATLYLRVEPRVAVARTPGRRS